MQAYISSWPGALFFKDFITFSISEAVTGNKNIELGLAVLINEQASGPVSGILCDKLAPIFTKYSLNALETFSLSEVFSLLIMNDSDCLFCLFLFITSFMIFHDLVKLFLFSYSKLLK